MKNDNILYLLTRLAYSYIEIARYHRYAENCAASKKQRQLNGGHESHKTAWIEWFTSVSSRRA